MKLSDLKRFSVEAQPHPTGGMNVSLFVLGDERVDTGSQRSLDVVSIVTKGRTETVATQNGLDFALELLKDLKPKADIVKLGVRSLDSEEGVFSASVELGLFDKSEEGADLIKKKVLGFGKGSDVKEAQKDAVKNALKVIGESK